MNTNLPVYKAHGSNSVWKTQVQDFLKDAVTKLSEDHSLKMHEGHKSAII